MNSQVNGILHTDDRGHLYSNSHSYKWYGGE